jgi:hypothetical protein
LKRWFLLAMALLVAVHLGEAQQRRSVTEQIEWTYSDQVVKPDPALPNVLLVGDSITRAYYKAVADELAGKANCYYFATSASIGDERLPHQLAEYFAMMRLRWDAVHFNNGMHGWGYTEQEYEQYFPEMLAAVRTGAAGARLVWAMTTPVRKDKSDGATNARIDDRNRTAAKVMAKEGIAIDDQHTLMAGHQDLHSDDVHFTVEGSALQGRQVAASVLKVLGGAKSGR